MAKNIAFALVFGISACVYADDSTFSVEKIESAADTIALINHINYVVETIRTYNNVLVLEQEYKNISVDNLNLNRIPDENVLRLITEILDSLNSMRMDERRLKRARHLMERGLADKKMQNMLDSSQKIVDAGLNTEKGLWGGLVAMGKVAIASQLESYVSYKKVQKELENELDDKLFELETSKLDKIHSLNIELLKSEWELTHKYSLDDNLRITGDNIRRLVECVKDTNHTRAYRRMLPMERVFSVYPTYWYFRTMFALEAEKMEDVISSAQMFFKVNRSLFRKDDMAAATAMAAISAMIELKRVDKIVIRDNLEIICKQNYDFSNPDYGIFCAAIYNDVIEDQERAIRVLGATKDLLEFRIEDGLVEYRNLCVQKPTALEYLASLPNAVDLARCRMLKMQIDIKRDDKIDTKRLKEACMRETTSSIEKLFYFGKLRITDLLNEAKEDIEAINLVCTENEDGDQALTLRMPIKWFMLGDVPISIGLMRGEEEIIVLNEIKGSRRHELYEPFIGQENEIPGVRMDFSVPRNGLVAIDGINLKLKHKTWPAEIVFAPWGRDYNIAAGGGGEGEHPFVAAYVKKFLRRGFGKDQSDPWLFYDPIALTESIIGKEWESSLGPELLKPDNRVAYTSKAFSKLIVSSGKRIPVGSHSIVAIEMPTNTIVRLRYRNDSNTDVVQGFQIVHKTSFDAIICYQKGDVEMKANTEGFFDVVWPEEYNGLSTGLYAELWILRGSLDEVYDNVYGKNSPQAQLRKYVQETLKQSGLEDSDRIFAVTDERILKAEFLKEALAEIKRQWGDKVRPQDVMLFIDESATKKRNEGVIVTCDSLYYFKDGDGIGGRLDDIESIDWERKKNGCIYINSRPFLFCVNKRKPFVDAIRKILEYRKSRK